jgi:hypothetical protein
MVHGENTEPPYPAPFQVPTVGVQISRVEVAQPPADALADLRPHLAKPWPSHAQPRQAPLQEVDAIGLFHLRFPIGSSIVTSV